MKCYHHNDMDGRAAAAIVLRNNYCLYGDWGAPDLEFIEMGYNKEVDIAYIGKDEEIVIVDFSFKPEVMKKVFKRTRNVTWIDHHKTAEEYDYGCKLKGLRNFNDKELCGAELAWFYYFPDRAMPAALKMIGDYDTWRNPKGDSLAFYEGAKMLDGIEDPRSRIWETLLSTAAMIFNIIKSGYTAIKYREAFCENFCKSFGYEATLDGHKCYVANLFSLGSKTFGKRMGQYEFCCAYVYTGKSYTISLYAENGFDVSEIAKAHGGGGHKGAAGMVMSPKEFLSWMGK